MTHIFNDGAFDDLVVELTRLKQRSSLVEYSKHIDNILDRVMISEDIALRLFSVRFKTRSQKINAPS